MSGSVGHVREPRGITHGVTRGAGGPASLARLLVMGVRGIGSRGPLGIVLPQEPLQGPLVNPRA